MSIQRENIQKQGKCADKKYVTNLRRFAKDVKRDRNLLLILLPGVLYFIIFKYIPMGGIVIAFKDYNVYKGILGSNWNDFAYFKDFFGDFMFWRLFRNTILLGLYTILWGFPIPIIFALLLNEVKNVRYKRSIQTISYLPHFISTVIVVGMVLDFLSPSTGIINRIITLFGGEPISFMVKNAWFRTVYVTTGIWQATGWNAIIYLAAITNVDVSLYDAAKIDGAGRFKQVLKITIPSIIPTITVLFILRIGGILENEFEKVLLMQNPAIYETADVLDTFIYRRGIESADFGYATAVGLAKSIVALCMLTGANFVSRKLTDNSLW